MFSSTVSAAICGIEARRVTVEADVSDGMPSFSMVGYLSSEVREAQDRVRTSLRNIGLSLPLKRVTVNLAPADLRKEGAGYDLAIAVAVLCAMGVIPVAAAEGILFVGELSLSGQVEPVRGILEMVLSAKTFGCHSCIIPAGNLREGSFAEDVKVYGADSLTGVIGFLRGETQLERMHVDIEEIRQRQEKEDLPDFSDVRGMEALKRAAEVAAAGGHNLLIIGPPGAGKTMVAKRIPSILPRTTIQEILEISRIHSVAGILPPYDGLMTVRPFRSPHHTITPAGMGGGGIYPRPGEVSLSHRGILYIDEMPEYDPRVLEILRQPLEDKEIHVSRNAAHYTFPACCMLVASMNPCKCGYYPDRNRCRCRPADVKRYLSRISQPLLDRIDICVETGEPSFGQIRGEGTAEASSVIRERVQKAASLQEIRYAGSPFIRNADLDSSGVEQYCSLGKAEETLMRQIFHTLHLTGRSYTRILKVARTIADLEGSERILEPHLKEASFYRMIDRKYWGGMV